MRKIFCLAAAGWLSFACGSEDPGAKAPAPPSTPAAGEMPPEPEPGEPPPTTPNTPGESETPPENPPPVGEAEPKPPPATAPNTNISYAEALTISEIAMYQAVKVPVMLNGVALTQRNAPLVAGRDALVRVSVRPDAGFVTRPIVARLDLYQGTEFLTSLEETITVSQESNDERPDSTFNFFIPKAQVPLDLAYAVSLLDPNTTENKSPGNARFPATGNEISNFWMQDSGGPLEMVIVPVVYLADGSSRLPAIDEEQMERYRQRMYALYPTSDVKLSVREAVRFEPEISRSGAGWGQLLQGILQLRRSDGVGRNVYYYGIFMPKDSFREYCTGSCILGLSNLGYDASIDYLRGSIGIGFPGEEAAGTFVHEIGHAHGREHAPCGVGDPDQQYPYSRGQIGGLGFDITTGRLYPPQLTDFMGYCDPTWISDYTYSALFDRISAVNQLTTARVFGTAGLWRTVIVEPDGSLSLGGKQELSLPPNGEQETVILSDAGGKARAVTGYKYPFSHLGGGLVLVPEFGDDVRELRVQGRPLVVNKDKRPALLELGDSLR